eukprot:SAG31_NODE_35859_length_319_cov_0.700000_1_plen_64_part_01
MPSARPAAIAVTDVASDAVPCNSDSGLAPSSQTVVAGDSGAMYSYNESSALGYGGTSVVFRGRC